MGGTNNIDQNINSLYAANIDEWTYDDDVKFSDPEFAIAGDKAIVSLKLNLGIAGKRLNQIELIKENNTWLISQITFRIKCVKTAFIEYKVYSEKVWIRSLPGEAWTDCASGIYPTKSDIPIQLKKTIYAIAMEGQVWSRNILDAFFLMCRIGLCIHSRNIKHR